MSAVLHQRNGGRSIDTEVEYLDGTPVPPPAVRCSPRRSLLQRAWRFVRRLINEQISKLLAIGHDEPIEAGQ